MTSVQDMWEQLQKKICSPRSELLSQCEAELMELMQQIDSMVSAKCNEWNRERMTLNSKLEGKAHEESMLRSSMKLLKNENVTLKDKIKLLSESHKKTLTEYDHQITDLKDQVTNIKKENDKNHQKYIKQNKTLQKENEKITLELKDCHSEQRNMKQSLQDITVKLEDSENHNKSLQKHSETLKTHTKELEEQQRLLQLKLNNYQTQVDRENFETQSDCSSRASLLNIEKQLNHYKELATSQETQILQLQASLNNNQKLQQHGTDNQSIITKLQNSQSEFNELENKVKLMAENESRIQNNMKKLEKALEEKNNFIIQMTSADNSISAESSLILQTELDNAREEIRNFKKSEKLLKSQIFNLKEQQNKSKSTSQELRRDLIEQVNNMKNIEKSEIQSLKSKITQLETEVNKKENLSTCSQKEDLVCVERTCSCSIQLISSTQEIRALKCQLAALHLENQQLQNVCHVQSHDTNDKLADDKLAVTELRDSYDQLLKEFLEQNKNLSLELNQLRKAFTVIDGNNNTVKTNTSTCSNEERLENEKKKYELEIRDLQSQIFDLKSKLEKNGKVSQDEELNTVLNLLCNNTIDINENEPSLLTESTILESTEEITQRFLKDQDARTESLKAKLDLYVENLKQAADNNSFTCSDS